MIYVPQLVLVQGAQADHLLRKLQGEAGQGMCLPPVQQVPVKGRQMRPPNQETAEWQELTQPRLLMESLRSLQVPDFCFS